MSPRARATVVGALAVAAYVVAALTHALVVNTDPGKFDQDVYLLGIGALKTSQFGVPTNRVHMPVYLYAQALFWDVASPAADAFLRAKVVNVALSLGVVAAVHAFFARTLPRFEARLLTAIAAFTVFVFRAGYVQAEALFYGVSFAGFIALARLWERPTVLTALVAGLLEAIAHLTKASVLPGFLLVIGLCAVRAARGRDLRQLAAVGLAPLAYVGALVPYLRNSKHYFGSYFFTVQTSYVLWFDSWEDFKEFEIRHGPATQWHGLPADQLPSLANYVRTHSLFDVAWRTLRGFAEMVGNSIASYGWAEFLALYVTFALLARPPGLGPFEKPRDHIPGFVLPYVATYVLLFSFYGPIAAGNRFILGLFLPLLWIAARACVAAPEAVVRVGRRPYTFAQVNAFAVGLVLVHICFRLPATITRIKAGG